MTRRFSIRLSSLALAIIIILSLFSGCKKKITLNDIPDYSGSPYVEINGNEPFFTDNEITDKAFESYSPLDALGRCGVAFACIGIEIMPTEERSDIANIIPSGWEYNGISNNNTYDFVENNYVYNRCHLIGFQLAGENDNEKNLITGTRYMNIEGMLPFENMVADYVESTGNHVMYRVTPMYTGLNYVANGVLMEAFSVEDNGRGIEFCIYAYNVQPGVYIDYFIGANVAEGQPLPDLDEEENSETATPEDNTNNGVVIVYILNVKSKKFHYPNKSCADSISEENREQYEGTREELIAEGYSSCGICKP